MQPRGNLVADPICRTADFGLTITGTADAGTCTIIDAPPRSLSRGTAPTAPNPGNCVITLSADWLTCRSWGFPPACTFVPPPIHLHQSTMSEDNLPNLPQLRQ